MDKASNARLSVEQLDINIRSDSSQASAAVAEEIIQLVRSTSQQGELHLTQ